MFPLSAGKHVSVASVIRDEMKFKEHKKLEDRIMEVARSLSLDITDAAVLLALLQTDAAMKTIIIDTVESFVRSYLKL